jgi:hypothetical protein
MSELRPERFGGERRYILRGRVDSQSSHLMATFLKRVFASLCAVGALLQNRPTLRRHFAVSHFDQIEG